MYDLCTKIRKIQNEKIREYLISLVVEIDYHGFDKGKSNCLILCNLLADAIVANENKY